MKLNIYALAVGILMMAGHGVASAQQQEKQPDVYEQAELEADRLQGLLDLEDWQVFYVDSTLKHDFPAMMADYEELKKAKVANQSMYQDVHDKWMDQIDKTYMRIFTDEQWAKYLKNGAARAQKARAKRKAKK
jgi:hypothetical protein